MVRKAAKPGATLILSRSSLYDGKGVNMSNSSRNSPVLAAETPGQASGKAVGELISKIKDSSPEVRTQAWLEAGSVGAVAVKPLSAVMTDQDLEMARAAKRALWEIVHHAGRPGARDERRAVVSALVGLLNGSLPVPVTREILWMLSEVGGREAVQPMAQLLTNKDVREDARMTLERIPGRRSLTALRTAFDVVPDDFKSSIAQSLRCRGEMVSGYPCAKLIPSRNTEVRPLE